ncbi:MAG: adenylate/guanylate cyclase domain-containing protein [Myxococcota bacterium]|nr:adenylate/guanylate cyclase domain-containing protein [Myxococcota bacterium]
MRTTDDLQLILARNVGRGERSVAVVRVAAAFFVLLQLLWADRVAIADFHLRPWLVILGLGSGIGFSLWTLRSRSEAPWRLWASTVVDSLVVTVALWPTVIWAREIYPGQFNLPGLAFYALAMAVSGLRLDRRLVWTSIALNGAAAVGLGLLDQALNGPFPMLRPTDVFIWLAMFVGAGALGDAITVRTRRLVTEAAQAVTDRERARQALGVYVSETVAQSVLDEGGGGLELGGARRQVVVLFSDLRGFTAYSDALSPERLVAEVNAYLDRMVEVISAHGGVVDKYIGDAIMVVFGLPEAQGDDAERAVRCALGMQEALELHNGEREARGLPPLRQGIGVHRGWTVAGNIGSADRLQYTVMGATVNLASRLESATKAEGVSVLVSDAVVQALPDLDEPLLKPHGELQLRGASEPVVVWTTL